MKTKRTSIYRTVPTGGLVIGFLSLSFLVLAMSETTLEVGKFSEAQAGGPFPDGWKPLIFEKIKEHTQYELVENGNAVVVKAVSNQSSSGLTRGITIDPKEYPII